jgi:hypothetical protein
MPSDLTQDNGGAEQARKYVSEWAPRLLGKEATYVTTSNNRLIHFSTMSDDDAIWVATQLRSMEIGEK